MQVIDPVKKEEIIHAIAEKQLVLPSKDLSNELNLEILKHDLTIIWDKINFLLEDR